MYVAEKLTDGEEYAVKISKGRNACSFARNEYLLLKNLDHPNIPKVYGYFANEEHTKAFLVMEYLSGFIDLNEHIKEHGPLEDDRVM